MGCLYLDIEGQSCLVDMVDQGLMKNRQIDLFDGMTEKEPENKNKNICSPYRRYPESFTK